MTHAGDGGGDKGGPNSPPRYTSPVILVMVELILPDWAWRMNVSLQTKCQEIILVQTAPKLRRKIKKCNFIDYHVTHLTLYFQE